MMPLYHCDPCGLSSYAAASYVHVIRCPQCDALLAAAKDPGVRPSFGLALDPDRRPTNGAHPVEAA